MMPQYLVVFRDPLSRLWELTAVYDNCRSFRCENVFTSTSEPIAEIASKHWLKLHPMVELIYDDNSQKFSGERSSIYQFALHGTRLLKQSCVVTPSTTGEKNEL